MSRKRIKRFLSRMSTLLNLRFIILFCMIVLNFLFMHYYIATHIGLEDYPNCRAVSNLWACVVDAVVIYLFSYLLTIGRVRVSLPLAFSLSMVLAYANILYARFFGIYLPKNVLFQIGNLNDKDVLLSILSAVSYVDALFLVFAAIFGFLYVKWKDKGLQKKSFASLLTSVGIVYMYFILWLLFHIGDGKYYQSFKDGFYDLVPYYKWESSVKPNIYLFKMGFTRRFLYCMSDYISNNYELTQNQIDEIASFCSDHSERISDRPLLKDKNLIFILVESYLSETIDLVVDGHEITPFMNRLKTERNVYFNSHIHPNITCGQSSDGQLIYMTGLLPLRSVITVDVAKSCQLKGLPKLLKEYGRIKSSHIVIPTVATFWSQDDMCKVYGIDKIYSKDDVQDRVAVSADLTDEQLFSMASSVDCQTAPPFFSLILTMSMHGPYHLKPDSDFTLTDSSLPEKYRNYLIKCHYFDEQIEQYINSLKETGVYDRSVIVIASDHHIEPKQLDMEGRISTDLPLFIINGDINMRQSWTGTCNQLDVYTTLLDLFVRDDWCGLGHTLLRPKYRDSYTPQADRLSEWILRGDFFNQQLTAK